MERQNGCYEIGNQATIRSQVIAVSPGSIAVSFIGEPQPVQPGP
jgi:hypothetical protein